MSFGQQECTTNILTHWMFIIAGIPPHNGKGFDEIDQDDCVTMVQLAIQKCIEKEAFCNEFYLQLIKQTTDQPGTSLHTSSSSPHPIPFRAQWSHKHPKLEVSGPGVWCCGTS